MISVVIPTLNAAGVLGETLASVSRARAEIPLEIIVADGGSVDDTALIAERDSTILIEAPRGRGRQLARGVQAASGDWFLFLHADTRLAPSWSQAAGAFAADPRNRRRAGYFRFRLDDTGWSVRVLEATVLWRCRVLALPYGDQGLLISRGFYEELGGYRAVPLMEDVDLVRRIGRRRLRALPARAVTSAEKYRRDGYLIRPLRNLLCLGLYSVGVPPRYIESIYR